MSHEIEQLKAENAVLQRRVDQLEQQKSSDAYEIANFRNQIRELRDLLAQKSRQLSEMLYR